MTYINVGAFIDGARPKSKKAVREALAENPGSVSFDCTAALTDFAGCVWAPEEIDPSWRLSLVGPDPYTSRRFYGTVTRSAEGVYKVE